MPSEGDAFVEAGGTEDDHFGRCGEVTGEGNFVPGQQQLDGVDDATEVEVVIERERWTLRKKSK